MSAVVCLAALKILQYFVLPAVAAHFELTVTSLPGAQSMRRNKISRAMI
jgi:hypothetical protein